MELLSNKGNFILPSHFSISMTYMHPFFSNEGSYSLPVTLPYCAENLKLLGFPNRVGAPCDTSYECEVTLIHGRFHKSGRLIVDEVNTHQGISCSLVFNESLIFSKFNSAKLRDLFRNKTSEITCEQLYDIYLKGNPPNAYDFAAFPVYIEEDDFYSYQLNALDANGFIHNARELQNSKGDTLKLPQGYGVTPFPYLWIFLREMFELAGYTVKENCFNRDPFYNIVLINNCADAMCVSPLKWSDIVPDMTAGSVIQWLKDRFGAIVIYEADGVSIKFIDDVIKSDANQDLSDRLAESYSISRPKSSRISLDVDTSLEGAAPLFETMEDLPQDVRELDKESDITTGLGYIPKTGDFIQVSSGTIIKRGSNAFRYYRNNSEECEDHDASDRFLPIKGGPLGLLTYIGKRIHRNTTINGISEDANQSLQICWNSGTPQGSEKGYHIATPSGYFPALTPEGVYSMLWEGYNDLLLNRPPEIRCRIKLPAGFLNSSIWMHPVIFMGRKALIKEVGIELSEHGDLWADLVMFSYPEPLSISDSVFSLS